MQSFIKSIIPYVIILLVVIVIRIFVITPVTVVGSSMYDTLVEDEILLLSKISYKVGNIKRFDVIVIEEPDDSIIKRVYGLPGDKVEYKDNVLYINDKEVEDKYATNETNDFTIRDICASGLENEGLTDEEINEKCDYDTVPDGYYLVLGDNRKVSLDSRSLGFISEDLIRGKAVFRIFPLDKIGSIS